MNIHEWQMLLVTFVPVSCSVLPVPQDLALLAKGARSYQTCRDEIEQRWKRHRKVQVGADMVHMCMSIQWICRTWSYTSHQQVYAVLPSGEPTYPTWGKGTSCSFIFKGALGKGYVSFPEGILPTCTVFGECFFKEFSDFPLIFFQTNLLDHDNALPKHACFWCVCVCISGQQVWVCMPYTAGW